MMIRAATDDVRFLLHIYHKMIEKLTKRSLWLLAVRSSLYCRCFCVNDNDYADWPPLPPFPGKSPVHVESYECKLQSNFKRASLCKMWMYFEFTNVIAVGPERQL